MTASRLIAIVGAATVAAGWWSPLESQAVFRADTSAVALYATVRDRDGRLIPDLPREAFEVLDDGVRVPITVFSNAPQPITAVVMADMSGSAWTDLLRIQGSLRHFIQDLRSGDRLRIGTFGQEVSLSHALTDDRATLERVVAEEMWPGGPTPLWRAIDAAVRSLQPEPGRQVVVALTDGVDYSPGGARLPPLPGGLSALRRRAEANPHLLIYAIGLGDPRRRQRLSGNVVSLARVTGGGHINLAPDADLGKVLAEVGEELRRQYVVGFVSRHDDGKVHRVKLEVSVRGATVRTRESYVSPGRPPAGHTQTARGR